MGADKGRKTIYLYTRPAQNFRGKKCETPRCTLYSRSKGKVFYAITTKLCKTSAFVLMLTYHWSQYLCKPLCLVVQIGPKIDFGLCCYDNLRSTLSFCNSFELQNIFFCFYFIASFKVLSPQNLLSSNCTVKN